MRPLPLSIRQLISLAGAVNPTIQGYWASLAPGVPHLANLPLASLQRVGLAALAGHLTNLPLLSRHGAAANDAELAMSPRADKAMMMMRMVVPLFAGR